MTRPGLLQRARQFFFPRPMPQLRRFAAARVDRLTADWMTTEASINEELRSDLNRLRSRGRELVNNNDYARKFRGMVENNIVGPEGFILQARVEDAPGRPDRLANAAIEAGWASWCSGCDITGKMSFRDLCEQLVGSLPSDGEFLVRMVRGADARNRFNFALQLIDVDRIDTAYNVGATVNSNAVIMGVEVDAYRRPVALHLFAAHPNDGVQANRQRLRVAVDETLHRFRIERAEQMRGIPWMAPGMLSLHHLGGFKLSALLAAEHGANHYGFFETPEGNSPIGELDPATGQTVTTSQPGQYDTLPAGVTFTPHDSKYPNEVFGPFVKTTVQRIASGWRVAYHSLANDLEGVSFSSIRSGTLEERDRWTADQAWFRDAFLEPVYAAWLQMALLSGALVMPNGSPLPAGKLVKFSTHEFQGRRWEWVDPKNDMEAKILGVRAGLLAPQDLSAQMGYDFEDTLKKISEAQKLADELGVVMTAYQATPGAMPAQPAGGQTAEPAAKTLETSQREQRDNTTVLLSLAAAMQASATREQPPLVINNHLPAINVNTPEVRVQVPETTVNVEAIMPVSPAPLIEVRTDAPVVNIVNEVTAVASPAQVVYEHPAGATAEHVRDAETQELLRTVTTFHKD